MKKKCIELWKVGSGIWSPFIERVTEEVWNIFKRMNPYLNVSKDEWEDEFLSKNWKDLMSIGEMCGDGEMILLGSGTEGIAWKIGSGASGWKVLKIVLDEYRKDFEEDIQNRAGMLWSGVGEKEAMIFGKGVFRMEGEGSWKIYWKVIEWLGGGGRNVIMMDDFKVLFWKIRGLFWKRLGLEAWNRMGEGKELFNPERLSYMFCANKLQLEESENRVGIGDLVEGDCIGLEHESRLAWGVASETFGEGWLRSLIDSMLWELGMHRGVDFIVENLGYRESVGKFIWFDA